MEEETNGQAEVQETSQEQESYVSPQQTSQEAITDDDIYNNLENWRKGEESISPSDNINDKAIREKDLAPSMDETREYLNRKAEEDREFEGQEETQPQNQPQEQVQESQLSPEMMERFKQMDEELTRLKEERQQLELQQRMEQFKQYQEQASQPFMYEPKLDDLRDLLGDHVDLAAEYFDSEPAMINLFGAMIKDAVAKFSQHSIQTQQANMQAQNFQAQQLAKVEQELMAQGFNLDVIKSDEFVNWWRSPEGMKIHDQLSQQFSVFSPYFYTNLKASYDKTELGKKTNEVLEKKKAEAERLKKQQSGIPNVRNSNSLGRGNGIPDQPQSDDDMYRMMEEYNRRKQRR